MLIVRSQSSRWRTFGFPDHCYWCRFRSENWCPSEVSAGSYSRQSYLAQVGDSGDSLGLTRIRTTGLDRRGLELSWISGYHPMPSHKADICDWNVIISRFPPSSTSPPCILSVPLVSRLTGNLVAVSERPVNFPYCSRVPCDEGDGNSTGGTQFPDVFILSSHPFTRLSFRSIHAAWAKVSRGLYTLTRKLRPP